MRALLDSASQISAITVACTDRLRLKRDRWTSPVTGLSGVPIIDVKGRVEFSIQPRFAVEPVLNIQAWVLPAITGDMPRNTLPSSVKGRYANLALADPSFDIASPIDLLLGGDVFPSIMDGRKVVVDENLPAAFSSVFGWVLIGPVNNIDLPIYHSLPVSLVSIEGLMENFWHVEEPVAAPESYSLLLPITAAYPTRGVASLFSALKACAFRQVDSRYRYHFVHRYPMTFLPALVMSLYVVLNH